MIVDTHTHVVAADQGRYPLRPPAGFQERSVAERQETAWYREAAVGVEELAAQMDAAGVQAALLVQAMSAYSYDNSYTADAAASDPGRFASVCCVDVTAEDPAGELSYWVEQRGVRGVRLFGVTGKGAIAPDDPRCLAVWERAQSLEIPVVVFAMADQLGGLATALRRFPDVKVALDHCGCPDLRGGAPFDGAAELLKLADQPGLHLKVTSRILEPLERDGIDSRTWVNTLAERFGAARLLWGSDFPATHTRSYTEYVELAQRVASDLPEADRARFLAGTALMFWPELGEH